MTRRPLLTAGIAAFVVVALGAAFLVSGGIYKTVNVGGGSLYVVNRFTGETQAIRNGTRSPVASETAHARQEKREQASAAARERWQRAHDLAEQMSLRSASVVGDPASRIYHRFPSTVGNVLAASTWDDLAGRPEPKPPVYKKGANVLLREPDWPERLMVCSSLPTQSAAVYFESEHAAAAAGYWPCSECGGTIHTRTTQRVTAREWPSADAAPAYEIAPNDDVLVLAKDGEWFGVSSVTKSTGRRTMCWIPKNSVKTARCSECGLFGYVEDKGKIVGICEYCRGTGMDPFPSP
jgi:hypothetical protein